MDLPLISYIVAVKNSISHVGNLRRSIEKLPGVAEFVVVDGGSTDGTREALIKLASEAAALKFIDHGPDRGIYDAWNIGLDYASGTYTAFIGIDDIPQREFIDAIVHRLTAPEAKAYKLIVGDGLFTYRDRFRRSRSNPYPRLLFGERPIFDLCHAGMLNHRSLFETRRFDPTYRLAGDLHFYLRLRGAVAAHEILYLPQFQAEIGQGGLSNSEEAARHYLAEYSRIERELGIRLGYSRARLRSLICLCSIPGALTAIRRVSWWLRAQRNLGGASS